MSFEDEKAIRNIKVPKREISSMSLQIITKEFTNIINKLTIINKVQRTFLPNYSVYINDLNNNFIIIRNNNKNVSIVLPVFNFNIFLIILSLLPSSLTCESIVKCLMLHETILWLPIGRKKVVM